MKYCTVVDLPRETVESKDVAWPFSQNSSSPACPLVFSKHPLAKLSRQYLSGLNRLPTHKQMQIILAESMFHGCLLYFRLAFIPAFGPSLHSLGSLMSVSAFFSRSTKKPLLISRQNTYVFWPCRPPRSCVRFKLQNFKSSNAQRETKQRSV